MGIITSLLSDRLLEVTTTATTLNRNKDGVLKSIFKGLKYDCLLGIIFTADVRDEMPMALIWLSGYETDNLCTEHDQR